MLEINKIYNENCLETMSRMPDNYIDLTVTSPPYDNLRAYKGYSFDFEPVANELFRVTKQGGVVVWVVGDQTVNGSESGTSFRQALFFKEIGFNLHDTMIYAKNNAIPLTHNRYEQCFEYMFVLSKGKPKTFNALTDACRTAGAVRNRASGSFEVADEIKYGVRKREQKTTTRKTKQRVNVWFYSVGANGKTGHPATFPEQLANDHIVSWSNTGELVYDAFMGSGTTAKMAIINGRNFIGSEISSKYCEIANKRIPDFLGLI